jgi:gliding motility-associated-like protein
VESGTFAAGSNPNSNEVLVDWGNSTTGRIWYREFNPAIANCEGFSDTLNITIYPEIIDTAVIVDALCNGDANGSITLDISGGKSGPYLVQWNNGMTGAQINGLAAGDYTAVITDELGCSITSQVYTVNEPDLLELLDAPVVVDARCFQETNGSIQVTAQGGTAPYRFNWTSEGFRRTTTDPMISGLPTGNYTLEVLDANNCSTIINNIFVDQPLLLEADIESLINDPVCPDAENGTAFIDAKGGTPDYQFFWSNNPTVDNQATDGLAQGIYTLEIFDANGCTANYTLEQTERDPNLFVPNAFSPNGDGVNDVFKPVADCDIVYSMQIFNKWGAIVFSTNNIEVGWDGTFNGASVQKGKYSYVIFWAAEINGVQVEQNIRGSLNIYQ